jgi:ribosome recycling factor
MILDITPKERDELLRLVNDYFQETRVEVRHTQRREYREALQVEEEVLRNLKLKLEDLAAPDTGISAVA